MSVELYFDMIGRKTAALIAASIEAGALLATDDEAVIAPLPRLRLGARPRLPAQRRPARHLGPGTDDRQGASDVAHHKKTLPVIYASEHAGPEDRERLAALHAAADPTAAEVAEIIAILERSGAREYTRDQARRYRDEALAQLDAAGVVKPEVRARLEEIIVGVISA